MFAPTRHFRMRFQACRRPAYLLAQSKDVPVLAETARSVGGEQGLDTQYATVGKSLMWPRLSVQQAFSERRSCH